MRYIKKPIPIEAIQWDGSTIPSLPAGVLYIISVGNACIRTREGILNISPGDWILGPGPEGEYWPVGREIFSKTYVPVKDE